MKYPVLVSVVMHCYNSSRFLKEAMFGILNQTFVDMELIIVDDGSTDESVDIVKEFSDERINLIRFGRNFGNYYARNVGINCCEGKYIAICDADDVAIKDRLEIQYNYLENKKHVGAIDSNYFFIVKRESRLGRWSDHAIITSLKLRC